MLSNLFWFVATLAVVFVLAVLGPFGLLVPLAMGATVTLLQNGKGGSQPGEDRQ